MDDLGMRVGAPWPKGISSVPYLYGMHRMSVLQRTMLVLKNTCKDTKMSGGQLAAIAILIHAAGRTLDENRLRKIMINRGGPSYYEQQIKAGMKGIRIHPTDLHGILAKRIVREY